MRLRVNECDHDLSPVDVLRFPHEPEADRYLRSCPAFPCGFRIAQTHHWESYWQAVWESVVGAGVPRRSWRSDDLGLAHRAVDTEKGVLSVIAIYRQRSIDAAVCRFLVGAVVRWATPIQWLWPIPFVPMFADRVVIQSGEGHNTQQADDDCSRKPKNPGIGVYWGKAEGESSDYANPLDGHNGDPFQAAHFCRGTGICGIWGEQWIRRRQSGTTLGTEDAPGISSNRIESKPQQECSWIVGSDDTTVPIRCLAVNERYRDCSTVMLRTGAGRLPAPLAVCRGR